VKTYDGAKEFRLREGAQDEWDEMAAMRSINSHGSAAA
jgi:hypothetical protein